MSVSAITVNSAAAFAPSTAAANQLSGGKAPLTEQDLAKRAAVEKSLWWWNLSCGILHLVQAAVVLGLGLGSSTIGKFKLPLTTQFLNWSRAFPGGPVTPSPQLIIRTNSFPFAAVTSGFAWMSAVAHFAVLLGFSVYIADLRKGINRFRWIEYAFSSSLMMALICMLFGMYDVIGLVLIMAVNACMNLFGYMMELHNQTTPRTDWTAFWMGCFAGAVPWAVVFAYAGGGSSNDGGKIPGFVWGILAAYLITFQCFPFIMVAQYKQWRWYSDAVAGFPGGGYLRGERSYQIASLLAKSLLLWLVVGGVNQPNSYTNGVIPAQQ